MLKIFMLKAIFNIFVYRLGIWPDWLVQLPRKSRCAGCVSVSENKIMFKRRLATYKLVIIIDFGSLNNM